MSGKRKNKYIQENYLLGELEAEKERIEQAKRICNDEILKKVLQEERDVDEAIAKYCPECGRIECKK